MENASSTVGEPLWLDDLNPQQREAAVHGDGPLLVVAGAGTGKTRTLAYRVAHLVHRGTPPERILLLTFTRRAAQEMIQRARDITRSSGTPRIWGGTFHSVATRLLRRYGKVVGLSQEFTVMDQSDSEDLIHMVRTDLKLASGDRRFPRKSTLLTIYSRVINSGQPLEEILRREYPWCVEHGDDMKTVFKGYVERKNAHNLLDYDDLLLFWAYLMEEPAYGPRIEDRFDHVLVDEYQDTNAIQARILRALRGRNNNLMVVGDDAQSIYAFRNADVRNMLDFPKTFPGTRVITLEQNYRSVVPILGAANAVLTEAREQYPKDLWSARESAQRPLLIHCVDEHEQTEWVVRRMLEHYEQGIPLRRQAVLFRIGYLSDDLEAQLTARNIPFHKWGGLRFLESAHIKDLIAVLRVVENPRDRVAWFRVLEMLPGVGPAGADRAFRHLETARYALASLREFAPAPAARERYAALVDCLLAIAGGKRSLPVAAQVERVRRFYEPMFRERYENPEARAHDLEQLEYIAQRYKNRREFLTELTLDPPRATSDLAGPPVRDEDYTTLSTIHSAKGCEWDVVFIIHAADGIIPSDMATDDSDAIEEERRLLYVAMTRARDFLYVTFPLRYYFRRRPRDDAHGYAQISRFLTAGVRGEFEELGAGAADDDEPAAPPMDFPGHAYFDRLSRMWD